MVMKNINENTQIKGQVKITAYDSETGEKKRETDWMDNLVVSGANTGTALLIGSLDTGASAQIDEGKIGTDDTAPTDGDTDLGSVSVSGLTIQSTSPSIDNITYSFFILDAQLTDGNYNEFGIFSNGNLFARSVFTNTYTKGANEDTRVDHKIIINN